MINKIRIIKSWDWLLLIGLMLAPMTGLRVWKIGPSELLCLFWGAKYLLKKEYQSNDILKFFLAFLISMLFGTMIGLIIAPRELVISDWFTWLFLSFVALSIYEGLKENSLNYNETLFFTFSVLSIIWYVFLYYYSIYVSKSFLGAPLWYIGVRYTGGAQNPHQVAILMCGLTFCFVRCIIRKKEPIISILCVVGAIFVEVKTASSTGLASIFAGFIATIMVLTFYKIESPNKRKMIIIMEFIIGVTMIVIFYPILYNHFYEWLASDANGLGRVELFSQIGNTFKKSPVFGLGPGMHALWGTDPKEYHNTYLEIIAASGLVGMASFLLLTKRTLKKMIVDATLIPILVAMYGYSLAGFAMRRLAYWGIFIFAFVIAEQTSKETDKVDSNV